MQTLQAADLIKRVRRLELSSRRAVSHLLAGQYHSVFKGRGMAFEEVRPYQPGDEVRTIDWNVTARMNEAYVKVFTEERELTTMLVVDVSASLGFGTRTHTKADVAAHMCAHIAFSAIANGDRVGLILFSDRIEKFVPPQKGRKHALRLLREILSVEPRGRSTDVGQAFAYLAQVIRRRAVAFVVSDFISSTFAQPLAVVSKRHDVVPVILRDSWEAELPDLGLVQFTDLESGRRGLIDTSHPLTRAQFREQMREQLASLIALFRKHELDWVQLAVDEDYSVALQRFFRLRAKRLAA